MKYTLKKLQAIGRLYNWQRSRGIVVDNGVLFMLQLTEELMLELMHRKIKPEKLGQLEILDKALKREKLLKKREWIKITKRAYENHKQALDRIGED